MKKTFVTLTFIFSFAVYSLYHYFGVSSRVAYVAPITSTANTSLPTQATPEPIIPNKNIVVSKPQTQTTNHPVQSPPAPIPTPTPAPVVKKNLYADGTYTGSVADAYYG